MSAIGPGDWVECVDTMNTGWLRVGDLYCVETVRPFSHDCAYHWGTAAQCSRHGLKLVRLEGLCAHLTDFHCADGFRPVYSEKSSLIETLKQPAPESVRELLTV